MLYLAALQKGNAVVAFILLYLCPQRVNRVLWAFYALHKLTVVIYQVAGNTSAFVGLARAAQ